MMTLYLHINHIIDINILYSRSFHDLNIDRTPLWGHEISLFHPRSIHPDSSCERRSAGSVGHGPWKTSGSRWRDKRWHTSKGCRKDYEQQNWRDKKTSPLVSYMIQFEWFTWANLHSAEVHSLHFQNLSDGVAKSSNLLRFVLRTCSAHFNTTSTWNQVLYHVQRWSSVMRHEPHKSYQKLVKVNEDQRISKTCKREWRSTHLWTSGK